MNNYDDRYQYPIVNAGQPHLLCELLIDTSSSMTPSIEAVNNALRTFKEALDANLRARNCVEVCLIPFNSTVEATPFMPCEYLEFPALIAQGCTSLHAALDKALEKDRERKDLLTNAGTAHYRSWLFVLSDGMPTDSDNGQITRLHDAQDRGSMTVFGVGIGESADREMLASLSTDGTIITATRENFEGAFKWLSDSLVKVAQSRPGEKLMLNNPAEPQYGGLQYNQIPVRG